MDPPGNSSQDNPAQDPPMTDEIIDEVQLEELMMTEGSKEEALPHGMEDMIATFPTASFSTWIRKRNTVRRLLAHAVQELQHFLKKKKLSEEELEEFYHTVQSTYGHTWRETILTALIRREQMTKEVLANEVEDRVKRYKLLKILFQFPP